MKRDLVWLAVAAAIVVPGACGRDDMTGPPSISATRNALPNTLRDVILFTTDQFNPRVSSQLATMNLDGSGRQRMTHDDYHYGQPAISPDGRRIAVGRSTSDFQSDGIYLMNADGTDASLLVRQSTVFDGQPAWSPDGRQIAFMSYVDVGGFGPYGRIFVINVDGTGLRPLVEADGIESQLDEEPSWSPDGTRIVFTRNLMLQVVNADGTGLTALPNEDFAVGATWSPDGRFIAYTSLNGGIGIRNADGSNPVMIAPGGGGPRWSPDGRRLVFVRVVGGQVQVFTVNVDGTGERRLSFGARDDAPTWSPLPHGRSDAGISIEITPYDAKLAPGDAQQFTATVRSTSGDISHAVTWSSSDPTVATVSPSGLVTGVDNGVAQIRAAFGGETAGAQVRVVDRVLRNAIIYSTDAFGTPEFAVVKPDGTGRRRLTTDQFGYESPDISPDGGRIVLSLFGGVFIINADAIGLTEGYTEVYTDFEAPAHVPVWSPDGSQIAFVSGGRVFVINADGSGKRQVSPDDPVSYDAPAWSPDGTRLVFTRDGVLQVINSDGSGLTSLGNADAASSPDWSPDGTRVAYGTAGGIRIRNVDGSGLVSVTAGADDHPRWSPDNGRLVFSRVVDGKSQLFVVNANGTGATKLTAGTAQESTPSWSPLP